MTVNLNAMKENNIRSPKVYLMRWNPSTPEGKPRIPMEKLQKEIPDFVWERGASGVLLSDDLAEKLAELF